MANGIDISAKSPGRFPGTDIRAGLAQVADFTPLLASIYGPKLQEQQYQIEAAEKAKGIREKGIQTALDKTAEGIVGREGTVKSLLGDMLSQARDDASWFNQYNIDPNGPLPAQVASNPNVRDRYTRYHNTINKINTLATTEKQHKDALESLNKKSKEDQTIELNDEAVLAQQIDSFPKFAQTYIERKYGGPDFYNSLDAADKQAIRNEIEQAYSERMPFNQLNYGAIKKDNIQNLYKKSLELVSPQVEEEVKVGGQFIGETKRKELLKSQIENAIRAGYDEYDVTTAGIRQIMPAIRQNNTAFSTAIRDVQQNASDEQLAKLGYDREQLSDPIVASDFFSKYRITDKGEIKEEPTINPITGYSLRIYDVNDPEQRKEYAAQAGGQIMAYKQEGLKQEVNPFALENLRFWHRQQEKKVMAQEAEPSPILGMGIKDGKLVSKTYTGGRDYRLFNLPKGYKNIVSSNAIDLATGRPWVQDQKGRTSKDVEILSSEIKMIPVDSEGNPLDDSSLDSAVRQEPFLLYRFKQMEAGTKTSERKKTGAQDSWKGDEGTVTESEAFIPMEYQVMEKWKGQVPVDIPIPKQMPLGNIGTPKVQSIVDIVQQVRGGQ